MKKRGLVISLLVLLAVITSGFTYAFWARSIAGNEQQVAGTVVIGEGGKTTLDVQLPVVTGSGLVPQAYTGTHSATMTFNVEWTEDVANTAGGSGTLDVGVVSYTLGALDEDAIDLMFTIVVTSGDGDAISVDGDAVEVLVTVTFVTEPATQEIYEEVAQGSLVITLSFSVITA